MIQSVFRGYRVYVLYRKIIRGVTLLQARFRGILGRVTVREYKAMNPHRRGRQRGSL
jgi:hypothetical protein